MSLVNLYRSIIPEKIRGLLHSLKEYLQRFYLIFQVGYLQRRALRSLKGKKILKCVFLALFDEVWKYDEVYRLMKKNPRFDPLILVCPIVNYGYDNMISRTNKCYTSFKSKGYNVVKAFDGVRYIDVIKELSPDILFYTNPYQGLIDDKYYITKYTKLLTVYVPYYFGEWNNYKVMCNLLFHNILWRYYRETPYHYDYSRLYSLNKARNVVVTGYPGIERLLNTKIKPSANAWKDPGTKKKRIIWAPHHSIEENGSYSHSCFLRYFSFMIEVAKKYSGEIQIVFKPHPLLKNKLVMLWGKDKTETYFSLWGLMPNTSLKEGDYLDLFLTSDAMIHDSGSFIAEYLYTNKPVMRTINDIPLEKMYNPFALKCLDQYYKAYNEKDIEQFIQNVINGVDPLKEQRTKFVNEVLMPKGSPSQNIIDDILDSIDNQILYRN